MIIFLYNLILILIILFFLPVIISLILLSEKRQKSILHRLCLKPFPSYNRTIKNNKKSIWVHALSVGEVLSALPLIKSLRADFPENNIFFSVSTLTGFEIASSELKQITNVIFFSPYDFLPLIKHIIRKINPDLILLVESDIWPNFLYEVKRKKIPVILVNAKLSERSFSGYKRFPNFSKSLFNSFSEICTQSSEDARRFNSIGVPLNKIINTGNIKFDQISETLSEEAAKDFKNSLNLSKNDFVILAGSTHKGEEIILAESFLRLKQKNKNLKYIVAPRDPKRAGSISSLFESLGFSTTMLTNMNFKANIAVEVIIIDIIGALKKLYAICDIAFIGGSLINFGGHNPLEPAAFGKPVIFGPHMSDFKEIAPLLIKEGGAVQVSNSDDLFTVLNMLINDLLKAKQIGNLAYKVFCDNQGAVKKILDLVKTRIQD